MLNMFIIYYSVHCFMYGIRLLKKQKKILQICATTLKHTI